MIEHYLQINLFIHFFKRNEIWCACYDKRFKLTNIYKVAKPVSRNSNGVGFNRVLLNQNKVKKEAKKVGFEVSFESLAKTTMKVNHERSRTEEKL